VILTHRNPEGEVSFFSTVARDITAQRRAEQTLRAAHALTSALIQTAPVAIITCDADLTVTGWNPAAERLFGWRTDEVVGRPFPVESPDGDVLAELREVISEGRTLQGREVHRLHRSGTPLDVLISTALLRDPKGEISRRVAFILDVTERKRLEQQFLQSQKMEAVGQLAGGVAHDFNNLLAVISSNLQMALDELPRDTEVYEAVRDAHQGASRAISLTRQLLAFSRSQVLELEPLDLSAVVADAERMLRRLVREDIRFDTQLGQGLPPVRADRGQLEQVLVNLVVNARDAMPRGGNLTLRTARVDLEEGPFLELTVQDTGVGMGEHTRAHLFEPFFTTKPVGKGTGLGLATVYGIVRQLEGRIDVESREGEGATFRVRIPITEPDGSPPSPSREGAPEAEVTGGDECILVVEDEPLVRSAIRRTLERYGYRVVEAEDGLDALEVHARERNQIALVLTDLVMPRLGGRALAERLEQAGARVPILFMSGYDREGAATAEAGTAVDLPKPFQTTALLRAIRQRLDG
jgi:PAS domain S-box-containing protein